MNIIQHARKRWDNSLSSTTLNKANGDCRNGKTNFHWLKSKKNQANKNLGQISQDLYNTVLTRRWLLLVKLPGRRGLMFWRAWFIHRINIRNCLTFKIIKQNQYFSNLTNVRPWGRSNEYKSTKNTSKVFPYIFYEWTSFLK